jgi:hypothetical protein
LNDAATVAFVLERSSGRALYLGNDPLEDRLIGEGDALCGSTVTEFHFHRFGLNDADELALAVRLADQRRLVVRAEPSATAVGECVTIPVPAPQGAACGVGALAALAALRACYRPASGATTSAAKRSTTAGSRPWITT